MRIILNKTDLYSADNTINKAIYKIVSEYWNKHGKKQYQHYKDTVKKYKRRKQLTNDEESDVNFAKAKIEWYKEIDRILKELDKRSKDEDDFFDDATDTLIDEIMKYRGLLWY